MEDPKLFSPCGTYCGICPYLLAYKKNDERLKEKLAKNIGIKPEQIICEGCNSDKSFFFCQVCKIRECVNQKGFQSCAECDDYPCENIEKFPYKEFLKRERWDVNYRKQYGEEQWFAKTIELNTCPSCQNLNHWRARICKSCDTMLQERYI